MLEVLMPHRSLILGAGALVLGVWAASGASVPSTLVLTGLWAVGAYTMKAPWREWPLWAALFSAGFFRWALATERFDDTELQAYHDERTLVTVEGTVSDYPDVRGDRIKLTVRVERVNDTPVEGMLLVTVDRYPEYFYGDHLVLTGTVQAPAEFEDFSYRNYLRRYGIDSVMYSPHVRLNDEARAPPRNGWFFLFSLKAAVEDRLNRLFTEPHASFAAGLLLGSRRGIPEAIMNDFNTSGLTHIIAISGYNITLIIVFVSGVFGFLSKRGQIIAATFVIVVFVVLVGATAAVVRAAIMGVLGLWAVWFGRRSEVTRLLAFTAAGMTLWNPFILVDDVGFQLSFAATCGLVYMTPTVERFLKWVRLYGRIPEALSIREAFVTTLAAQTLAVPVILASFGRLSLIAPMANVAAVSLIPLAMLTAFSAFLLSLFWWQAGLLVAYVGWFFLESVIQIAHWSALVPWASVSL